MNLTTLKQRIRNHRLNSKDKHPLLWTDTDQKKYERTIREFNELIEQSKTASESL